MRRLGFSVLHTREPGGTALGENIRKLLLDPAHRGITQKTEFLLYEAVRAQHVHEKISRGLTIGKVVVCERFSDASFAYQGYGRRLPLKSLKLIDAFATSGLVPDLTLLFDLPAHVGLRKALAAKKEFSSRGDRIERAGLAFHRRVRRGYLALAKKYNRIRIVPVLPGSSPESTFEKVRDILRRRIERGNLSARRQKR